MIEFIVQIVMSMVLLIFGVAVGISLLRMHGDPSQPTLLDLITATDKKNKTRLDARKCFEAGSFLLSVWIMVYITSAGKLSIEYFTVFLGVWTTARFLRDREKRLTDGGAK